MNVSPSTRFHCFFEQSGIFKREFAKLGFEAFDYDIRNDFGETDFRNDLFEEIRCGYRGEGSMFDKFDGDDFIIAFFPCVRFSVQAEFMVRAAAWQYISLPLNERLSVSMKFERERSDLYALFCKLVSICFSRNLRLIIENPYNEKSYLVRYFPIKPGFIDYNRRRRGDAFEKPTMFYFFNCKPSDNFIMECGYSYPRKRVEECSTVERSMITPEYANRFIREFIL